MDAKRQRRIAHARVRYPNTDVLPFNTWIGAKEVERLFMD